MATINASNVSNAPVSANAPILEEIKGRTSWVWEHFGKYECVPSENDKAAVYDYVCRVCLSNKSKFSDCIVALYEGSASNTLRHFKHKHPSLVPKASVRKAAPQKPASNSTEKASNERVFSLCKLIDSPLRQNLGDVKFEMLLVLAFNKEFIRSETDDATLADALESTTSASQAAATLVNLFDLDANNDETESGINIAETLGTAEVDPTHARAKKRKHCSVE
ncbi:hypothetical protein SDRG_13460 [Saprolegnia diclina VS20]|uniref:BED-type domain-containing protein n=1 Tax=Saprolegnia diclina (strain VS20) TaxID=1156394 RepID=T0RGF2_SAPDV|nr:hypothetical protein SDRG_13460 [Saprolegnia diclina VS20]EQC28777.1 hypothetical protein SDRG_13460 [Saprolegnia diclina VS20]|eukprot:XP_008617772.1 hypothetical protein SDRG_13460 [Saprolegnia diclina VS20]